MYLSLTTFSNLASNRKMLANSILISSNLSSFPLKTPNLITSTQNPKPRIPFLRTSFPQFSPKSFNYKITTSTFYKKGLLQICHSSSETQNLEDPVSNTEVSLENKLGGNGSPGGDERDWTTSILLFLLWVGLMYYVFNLTPNQTPSQDMYFLKKLLNLKGDDGFQMNEVLVSLWYIMGLWPLVYSMLLLPTGRRYLSMPCLSSSCNFMGKLSDFEAHAEKFSTLGPPSSPHFVMLFIF